MTPVTPGANPPDNIKESGKKAHLYAAGKREDGGWKLQFTKVEIEEKKETRTRPKFGSRTSRESDNRSSFDEDNPELNDSGIHLKIR